MKRNRKTPWMLLMLLCCTLTAPAQEAQEADTLQMFLDRNPNAVDFNVVYEGTKLYLAADDDNLLVTLSVAHPALQMRLLMQPTSIFIDPSGKKRKRYEVQLPSALAVKDQLEAMNPNANEEQPKDVRPDIGPLIFALNAKGATFKADGHEAAHLGYQRYYMELDTEEEIIKYYVLLPKEWLMNDKKMSTRWSVGICSDIDFDLMPPPPDQGGGDGMMPPPDEGNGNDANAGIQELMQQNIRSWTRFSIDDVNNANLQ